MSEKIDSTLNSVAELETGLGLFSKELQKIKSQLEELKTILNSQVVDEVVKPQNSTPPKVKKSPVVIRREDQEEPEIVTTSNYQIQVVGLGVQKME
jgi:hypothetical protein